MPVKPVLDALADNEEVALDETLDDLTVPLLPRAQLSGHWHSLTERRAKQNINTDHLQ